MAVVKKKKKQRRRLDQTVQDNIKNKLKSTGKDLGLQNTQPSHRPSLIMSSKKKKKRFELLSVG